MGALTSSEVTWPTTCVTLSRRTRTPIRSSSRGTSRTESPPTAWRTCTRSATPPSARTPHRRRSRVQGDQEEVERRQDRARRQEGQGGVPRPDRGAERVDFCRLSVLHLGLDLLK